MTILSPKRRSKVDPAVRYVKNVGFKDPNDMSDSSDEESSSNTSFSDTNEAELKYPQSYANLKENGDIDGITKSLSETKKKENLNHMLHSPTFNDSKSKSRNMDIPGDDTIIEIDKIDYQKLSSDYEFEKKQKNKVSSEHGTSPITQSIVNYNCRSYSFLCYGLAILVIFVMSLIILSQNGYSG